MARPDSSTRPTGKPEKLCNLLSEVLEEIGLGAASRTVKLLRIWDSAVGANFAPHCRPDGIRHEVIYARVRDSGWMQRIQLEKPRILERIEAAMGEPIARDLRFRIGELDGQQGHASPGGARSEAKPSEVRAGGLRPPLTR